MWPRLKDFRQKLGRLGIVFLALVLLYGLLYVAAPASGFTTLVLFALYVAGAIYSIRLLRRSVKQIIWRLRNRLIVTYLFIALAPVVLIVLLVGIGGYILAGQAAAFLVSSELERRMDALSRAEQSIASAASDRRDATEREVIPTIQTRFYNLEVLVRGDRERRYPRDSALAAPPNGWKDAKGIILKGRRFYSWAHVMTQGVEVTAVAPLTPDFLADLVPNLGEVFLVSESVDEQSSAPKRGSGSGGRGRRRNRVPPRYNRVDIDVTWIVPLPFSTWESPGKTDTAFLVVHTRPSAVLSTVFGQGVEFSQNVLTFFFIVAGLFLLVELVSLMVGVSLTRTITRAVHNLYEGTERVKVADFSHRIEVEGNDQLSELGRSFNRMTENLERLILVEKEQERLKSEIEIAREVQGQLFPRSAPSLKTLELTGVCHPARMVSGDYYDFLRLQDASVALAIGDVAGKGISAALLMASLQSIMRTQLTAGMPVQAAVGATNGGGPRVLSTAELVSQLNKQVYANTSAEKYATFFFGLYDDETRMLTYTNAGHLPPVLMRHGKPELLEVTGTVVGAFPFSPYAEKTIQLRAGDLLVAYTDGIVEPENEYGEAFGDDQLFDLLGRHADRDAHDIIARVMEAVELWTGSSELQDDMTVLLARGV